MSLTAYERETTLNMNDAEDVAYIYSAQRTVITRLKNNPAARLVEEGCFEGSVWARFEIPAALVSFRSVRVRRILTPEQRAATAERLRRARLRQDATATV
jgi:hypothetical protein